MAFHTRPTHPIRFNALHVTGLDHGTDRTWAATTTAGSGERHRVFPGRLHAAAHSWFKASLFWSCLKALATSKISAPSHSNDPGSRVFAGYQGLDTPHGPNQVKPSHVCKKPSGDSLRSSAGKQSIRGRRHVSTRTRMCTQVHVPRCRHLSARCCDTSQRRSHFAAQGETDDLESRWV